MDNQDEKKPGQFSKLLPIVKKGGELVNLLFPMTSSQALNFILDQENALQVVQNISRMDFFWLIKKIGEDDSLPVLKLASDEQWQYLLDLEIWQKSEIDLVLSSQWLGRMHMAAPERLAAWLLDEGSSLAYYYFFKMIQVFVREEDDWPDIPSDFFSLDNVFFIRILDAEHEDMIHDLLKHLAAKDHTRYQSLMLNLAGLIPAEHEEAMYRVRSARLAEDGFLPFEEAIAIYAYRKAESLAKESGHPHSPTLTISTNSEEKGELIPITPLLYAQESNLLVQAVDRIADPLLWDRVRLEFAGLCNRVMAADGIRPEELETLISICRKTAGYIHLGLEKLAADDRALAEKLLKQHPLQVIFQVGFSRALEIKWEVERWIRNSWFQKAGLKPDFWGEEWGGTLNGLLQKRPRLFSKTRKEEMFKEFETNRELEECSLVAQRLMVLDRLLERLAALYPVFKTGIEKPFFVFYTLLFNFWARKQLKLQPGFEPLTLVQVRDLLGILRGRSQKQPFEMEGHEETFVKEFSAFARDFDSEAAGRLRETLRLLWKKFNEEYEWVATADLDSRYSKFILVKPGSDVVLH